MYESVCFCMNESVKNVMENYKMTLFIFYIKISISLSICARWLGKTNAHRRVHIWINIDNNRSECILNLDFQCFVNYLKYKLKIVNKLINFHFPQFTGVVGASTHTKREQISKVLGAIKVLFYFKI